MHGGLLSQCCWTSSNGGFDSPRRREVPGALSHEPPRKLSAPATTSLYRPVSWRTRADWEPVHDAGSPAISILQRPVTYARDAELGTRNLSSWRRVVRRNDQV